ncbi:hypothetical protein MAPG_09039 [Magnaporthiopsis poae ATCC 64411]|uniref:Uncharacterized protein n=1 Tax=Magnaporthiopsis poae (strain ATCC 64411 / 73-15) TaxID=644358 RepID=A0A0C4E8W9_MAGP6|nr:hypothetical protein MAPG_09039 [Magnaporthiopsis poae ATCC 64411]
MDLIVRQMPAWSVCQPAMLLLLWRPYQGPVLQDDKKPSSIDYLPPVARSYPLLQNWHIYFYCAFHHQSLLNPFPTTLRAARGEKETEDATDSVSGEDEKGQQQEWPGAGPIRACQPVRVNQSPSLLFHGHWLPCGCRAALRGGGDVQAWKQTVGSPWFFSRARIFPT